MSKKVQFSLFFHEDVSEAMRGKYPGHSDFRIISQALDARGSNRGKTPRYHYVIEVIYPGEQFSGIREEFNEIGPLDEKPIIIGAGPAGLFCALRLSEYGIPSILIEKGARANERMKHIAKFWRYGELDEKSNVCFGEGGAGLFSDGKLITRVKSPYIPYVMNRLVDFGAPAETAYMSNPHLGSNKIRPLINKLSDQLEQRGCELIFNTSVEDFIFEGDKAAGVILDNGKKIKSSRIILATGHSAQNIYLKLKDHNVSMKAKDFAVGVRIEHSRRLIDGLQHGKFAGNELGAARYRLSWHNKKSDKGTYSFCMCPGGYVLSSGTETNGLVVNGMSNFARNSPWSNAALVVSVQAGLDYKLDDVLNGLAFQQNIEQRAFKWSKDHSSGREIPAQTIKSFLENTDYSGELPKTSCPSGIINASMDKIFPSFITEHLRKSLGEFDSMLPGFATSSGLLLAPETRTSAPITIERDRHTLESTSHQGLFPAGEGAGYAGGITSAAVDGVKIAMSIIERL
jgi:uncharacterized FAD-dependent dehydrogenase